MKGLSSISNFRILPSAGGWLGGHVLEQVFIEAFGNLWTILVINRPILIGFTMWRPPQEWRGAKKRTTWFLQHHTSQQTAAMLQDVWPHQAGSPYPLQFHRRWGRQGKHWAWTASWFRWSSTFRRRGGWDHYPKDDLHLVFRGMESGQYRCLKAETRHPWLSQSFHWCPTWPEDRSAQFFRCSGAQVRYRGVG